MQLLQIHARQIAHLLHTSSDATLLDPRDSGPGRIQAGPRRESSWLPRSPGIQERHPNGESAIHPKSPASASGLMAQMIQKHYRLLARQRLRTNQRVQFPRWSKTRHDRQVVSAQQLVDHWRLPFRPVGPDHPRHQIKARFVHKNQGSAVTRSLAPQLGPHRHSPVHNGNFITLDRSGNGDLRRPAQFLHQPRNVVFVVGNTKLPLDHLCNASTRPNVPTKPISLCSMPQKVGDACQLVRGQLRGTTGNRMAVQGVRSTRGRYRKPTTDRPFAAPSAVAISTSSLPNPSRHRLETFATLLQPDQGVHSSSPYANKGCAAREAVRSSLRTAGPIKCHPRLGDEERKGRAPPFRTLPFREGITPTDGLPPAALRPADASTDDAVAKGGRERDGRSRRRRRRDQPAAQSGAQLRQRPVRADTATAPWASAMSQTAGKSTLLTTNRTAPTPTVGPDRRRRGVEQP